MMRQRQSISIVMPCLNEERTIARSIAWARHGLSKLSGRYKGEIIVVDNGSTDESVKLARQAGARVYIEPERGYGRAYRTGLAKAKGIFIVLGDSDGTYDFRRLRSFIIKLEDGADLVIGTRLKGNIKPGAMPFFHRFVGTPLLTTMLNVSYGTHISDAQSGMRAVTKKAYATMALKSSGMEFASEMIVKAIYHKLAIAEVPIPYYPRLGRSKLSPLSDAWRHIKFMILFAPTYVLIFPGLSLFILGMALSLVLLPGGRYIFGWFFDIHTMTVGILAANLGLQLILLGLFAKVFTQNSLRLPSGPLATYLLSKITLERLLLSGVALFSLSMVILISISFQWAMSGYGELSKIREILLATGLASIGAQCVFASFLYGLLKES
ncbi:glycosyltransferase family 2 protein [Candidatus Gottesmanbacteria bacterium]|nr:glycosyltransferase family 2 protein [Candidatus Gottesmanbacteria bacterium]